MESSSPRLARCADVSGPLQGREKANNQFEGSQARRNLLIWRITTPFVSSKPSTDWMTPNHNRESNLPIHMFFSPKNTLTETLRMMLTQYLGTFGPVKVTHEINPRSTIHISLLCFLLLTYSTYFRSSFNEDLLRVNLLLMVNMFLHIWKLLLLSLILEW